jgi:hypothetical protein
LLETDARGTEVGSTDIGEKSTFVVPR